MNLEIVSCNLCGSSEFKKLFEVKGFNVVKCNWCGLVFLNPRLTQERLNKVYGEEYFKIYRKKAREIRRKNFLEKIKGIEKLQAIGRILDIGCATGEFLEVAWERGWLPFGVDLSEHSSYSRNPGFDVRIGELRQAKFEEKLFHAVTILSVFEHVRSPSDLLKEVRRVLRDDGLLVIETSNIASWCARVFKERFHLLDPLHLYYFSPRTLRVLLEKAGFEIIRLEYPYFKTSYFNLKELLKLASGKSASFYGNMMCVYAQKTGGHKDVQYKRKK